MAQALLNDEGMDKLFRQARTHGAWQDKKVSDVLLKAVYELVSYGPTSYNGEPGRYVFLTTPEAKARLKPYLMEGNVEKTMSAPVTVIVAQDMQFYDKFPQLLPHFDARPIFAGNKQLADETAFRNASLQGAYLMMAARALGLDIGAMSGFDVEGVNKEFFAETPNIKANFLVNIGYGDASKLHPRLPRLSFEEACKIL